MAADDFQDAAKTGRRHFVAAVFFVHRHSQHANVAHPFDDPRRKQGVLVDAVGEDKLLAIIFRFGNHRIAGGDHVFRLFKVGHDFVDGKLPREQFLGETGRADRVGGSDRNGGGFADGCRFGSLAGGRVRVLVSHF